jgi:hypothetical protein
MAREKGALPPKNKEKRENTASWIMAASGLIAALAALICSLAVCFHRCFLDFQLFS